MAFSEDFVLEGKVTVTCVGCPGEVTRFLLAAGDKEIVWERMGSVNIEKKYSYSLCKYEQEMGARKECFSQVAQVCGIIGQERAPLGKNDIVVFVC